LLVLVAAASALLASVLWLMSEAATLSGDAAEAMNASAVWSVVADTHFGQVGAFRCVLLLLILLAVATLKFHGQRMWAVHSLLSAVVVGSLAWTGHGNIDSGVPGWVHLGSDLLHLLMAGLWIGALLPLCVLVLRMLRRSAATSEYELAFGLSRFSSVGVPLVAVLLLSGVVNSWFLIGPAAWPSVLTTLYGRLLLAKVGLFVLMLALAAINRLRLTPRLQHAASAAQSDIAVWHALRATLMTETTLAMFVLGLVAMIGTLEPPIATI
jgi:putative copper resistance protein D